MCPTSRSGLPSTFAPSNKGALDFQVWFSSVFVVLFFRKRADQFVQFARSSGPRFFDRYFLGDAQPPSCNLAVDDLFARDVGVLQHHAVPDDRFGTDVRAIFQVDVSAELGSLPP